jgi:hypothetical protein
MKRKHATVSDRMESIKKLRGELVDLECDYAKELLQKRLAPISQVTSFKIIRVDTSFARYKFKIYPGTGDESPIPLKIPLVIKCSNGLILVHCSEIIGNHWETWHAAYLNENANIEGMISLSTNPKMSQTDLKDVYRMHKKIGKKLMKILINIVAADIYFFTTACPLEQSDIVNMYKPIEKTVNYKV